MRKKDFNIISRKTVLVTPRMEIEERQVECPDGVVRAAWVRKKVDYALIVPEIDADTFVLINQYRYGIERYSLEFPQGSVIDVEIDEAARIELAQEAGYQAETFTKLGNIYLSPGYSQSSGHVFCAEGLTLVDKDPEDGEFIEVITLSGEELEGKIVSGEITDAGTISAYYLYLKKHSKK